MTEEVAKIKANKDGTYIDIVPEKCVSAQKAQYDENGRDLLDAESSQTIKGANTFAAKQTFTGGVAVSGTSAIAGNVNMDSGDLAIGAKVTASNTGNSLKVANHNTALISNDVLSAKDINTPNGDANNLMHRSGDETVRGVKTFEDTISLNGGRVKISSSTPYIDQTNTSVDVTTDNAKYCSFFQVKDKNGVEIGDLIFALDANGNAYLSVALRKADGSTVTQTIKSSM